jgi:hypothetical protein
MRSSTSASQAKGSTPFNFAVATKLATIVLSHNLTLRKSLGFLTPLQALLGELGRDVQIRFA